MTARRPARLRFTPEPVTTAVPPSQRGWIEAAPEPGRADQVPGLAAWRRRHGPAAVAAADRGRRPPYVRVPAPDAARSEAVVSAPASPVEARPGIVYLIHFDQVYMPYPGAVPRDCAGHYTGFAEGGPRALARRLAKHGTSRGAAADAAPSPRRVSRGGWPGPGPARGDRERQLKRQGGAGDGARCAASRPVPASCPATLTAACPGRWSPIAQLAGAGQMTAAERAEHTQAAPRRGRRARARRCAPGRGPR